MTVLLEYLYMLQNYVHLYCRYYLKGPKEGQWDIFISNLPGIIDNVTPSKKYGGFWITIPLVQPTALLEFPSWEQIFAGKV